jgi:hypothetical protein
MWFEKHHRDNMETITRLEYVMFFEADGTNMAGVIEQPRAMDRMPQNNLKQKQSFLLLDFVVSR